ncbi:metal transporter [Halobacteriales archaeon QH_6_68_27]|nr:MAG: metal transporter [Halobacteriales archaeon QH_6_68_27]
MHIPDGYVNLSVAVTVAVVTVVVLAVAARRVDGDIDGERAPLVGVVAAGIFAAQMLNWPIPGGTSAHFVGGALAAVLLGPHLGALAVATVVTVQSLVFGDGGVGVGIGLSSAFAYETLTVLAVMGVSHLLLGLVEGAITAVVSRSLVDARPDLWPDRTEVSAR